MKPHTDLLAMFNATNRISVIAMLRSTLLAFLFATISPLIANQPIEIWIIPGDDPSQRLDKIEDWDAVITREQTIKIAGELRGLLSDNKTDFVLISVNESSYPVWVLGSNFDTSIPLEKGENTVTAVVRRGDYSNAQIKVIRVDDISEMLISEMILRDDGSEQTLFTEDPIEIGASQSVRTRIPRIQLAGSHNLPPQGSVEAFFQQRNERLPVAMDDETFTLNCSLMQGDNDIVIRTKMGRTVIDEQTITIRLDRPIELATPSDELESQEAATTDKRRFVTTNQKFLLKGKVPGVSQGRINVSMGDAQFEIPIVNHQFEHPVDLEEGAEHQISLSLPFAEQRYFDQVTVQHHSERIEVNDVHVRQLGTRDFEPLVPGSEGYIVYSPRVALHGESVSALDAWVRNGDFLAEIEVRRGKFVVEVPLKEGENEVEFFLGTPDEPKALDIITFQLMPIVEIVHDLIDDNDDGIHVYGGESGELFPAGRVPGMVQGTVFVKVGEESITLPVTNGVFRAEKPFVLAPSVPVDYVVNVTDGSDIFSDSLKVMWQAPLGTEGVAGRRVMTPPRPIKTVLPVFPRERFEDRGKQITVSFIISSTGKVVEDSFEFSTESEVIINAITDALLQWEFDPARENGVPVNRRSQMVFEARSTR